MEPSVWINAHLPMRRLRGPTGPASSADEVAVTLARRLRDLFEAAGELTAAHDEDAVLHTAIRKARQLLGTDLAYVMLLDRERGDTYMRATEGATSPRFDTIRLGMGLGLGGQVAEAMAPRWTRNYLEDEQYTHVIDPIIVEEGLAAILGVPVKKHGTLTGILFTSDRSARDFSQDDITVLALLADHTSIALDAAERAGRTEADLAETRDALSAERAVSVQLEAAMDLHENLTRLVVAGAPVPAIVEKLVELSGGSAAVFDDALAEIGSAQGTAGPPLRELRRAVEEVAEHLASTVTLSGTDDLSVVVTPVVTGSDHLGYVAHAGSGPRPDIGHVLERVGAVIALILLGRRARDEADNRVRGELLAEILSRGTHDLETIGRRAALLGVDVTSDLVALVAAPADGTVARVLQTECSALARHDGGLVTAYGDRVVLLVPGTDAGEAARAVANRLSLLGATVGASGPLRALAGVDEHVERARRAARLLIALGRVGEGAATEELGMYGLLFSEVDRAYVESFVERTVGPVRDYDRARGTALLDTLRTWFEAEGSASGAADRLFVHVNTVYQRLERLDRLLGRDWRSGDRALELRLALRLWDLMVT